MEFYHYIIAILGGALAGIINTLAGNGSAITLTILTEVLQLPGNLANGTNRVGIMTQSLASTYVFYKNDKLKVWNSWPYIVLTVIGAIAGVIVATIVSNEQFKSVFTFMMVAMLFVVLIKPKRWLQKTVPNPKVNYWLAVPLFLAVGFYGGFIQMGMGIIFLAAMVMGARYSITDSNAVKILVVAIYTVFVIGIFHWKGLIDWKAGSVLAIGQTAGGWLAANFATKYEKADIWAYRLLVAIVILAIAKLFGLFELFS
ncbi:MAG: sulfite exporter TauE/SafE family protein [Bacteroidota bacterium]